ncbi:MAG TPA: hypothetical protein ENI51_10650, partial [Candidatus Atribacteria bacterium]|nr:hypothetical protein [Candidatus Atribacteria bacterium]
MKNKNIKFLGIFLVGLVLCGTLSSTFLSADSSSSLNIKIKKLDSEELKNSLKLKNNVPNEIAQILEQQVNKLKIYQEAQENPIKEVCIDSSSYTFSDLKPGYKYKVEIYYDVIKVGESEWILLSSGDQKQIEITPEPQAVTISAILSYVSIRAGIGATSSIVTYAVTNWGSWECEEAITVAAIGGATGACEALIDIFGPPIITKVYGYLTSTGVVGIDTLIDKVFRDKIERAIDYIGICDINYFALFNVLDIFQKQENKEYMESQLQSEIEKLVAENPDVGIPESSGWWIDFSTQTIKTSEGMQVSTHSMDYNSNYDGSWLMHYAGSSSLTASFSISQVYSGAILRITHLTSYYQEDPRGGYSPVDIEINGNLVADNYDPAENHNGSHDYVEDAWQISQYLRTGNNTIRISFQSGAVTNYWIKQLTVTIGKDNLAEVKVSTNKNLYGAGENIYLNAEVTNSVGTYLPASCVT